MLDRIKSWFAYSRTILAARIYALVGGLVTFHDMALPYVTGADLTPITAKVPPVAWLGLMIGTGILFEWLRRITTEPLSAKGPSA